MDRYEKSVTRAFPWEVGPILNFDNELLHPEGVADIVGGLEYLATSPTSGSGFHSRDCIQCEE